MASIPYDVILQILLHVPAKSVLRFRCVSKHCLSITTDPSFIKLHLQRSIENDHLNFMIFGSSKALQDKVSYVTCGSWMYCLPNSSFDDQHELQIETLPLDCFKYGSIAGSCNGLVCLIKENCGMVLNPATREFHSFQFDKVGVFSYAVYGLGYDYVMEDYKLVEVRRCFSLSFGYWEDSEIVVHSLNDSPSVKISDVPYYVEYPYDCGVYLDGALHWVGSPIQLVPPLYEKSKLIISFDVAHKRVQEFPLPVDTDSQITLGLLQGQLSSFINLSFSFEIWIMKTYGAGDSWYKLASIDKTVYGGSVRLLCFSKSGGVLLSYGEDLFLYDPEQKTCKKIELQGINRGVGISIISNTLLSCVASCVSVQSGSRRTQKASLEWLPSFCRKTLIDK